MCPGNWCEVLHNMYWARIDVGGLTPLRLRNVKSGDQHHQRRLKSTISRDWSFTMFWDSNTC